MTKYPVMHPILIAAPTAALGAAALTAYAAVHRRSQLFGPTVFHTDSSQALALTFDDGPNPSITPKLLDLLARYDARATFFIVGKFVRKCPDLVKETASRGHVIGNHTDTHPNLFFTGPEETRQELLRCTDAIQHATWSSPQWFRPPFGYRSPWLSEIVHRQGMHTALWTLIPGDWRAKSNAWLIDRMKPIAAHLQHLPAGTSASGKVSTGDILCLHDGNFRQQNADRSRTLAALEYWLPRWRDLGLEFVTMNQTHGKVAEA